MTVVLAIACADGMVVASDTQVTDPARGMSYPDSKVHVLGDSAAWGGSGARSVLGELEVLFADAASALLEADDRGRAFQELTLPVLRHHYEHFIAEVPGEDSGGTPSAYVLVAGYDDGNPWILEINPHGMVSRYDDIAFHAVGSGAPMAHQAGALLAHFRMTERTVGYGVLAAVRVLDALTTTVPSVGGELDVCRITDDGVTRLDEDDVDEVRSEVARWKAREQELLDDLAV